MVDAPNKTDELQDQFVSGGMKDLLNEVLEAAGSATPLLLSPEVDPGDSTPDHMDKVG